MTRPRVVVVGAGVAGSVVASRLAPHCDLVVVEAGDGGATPTDPRMAMVGPADFVSAPYPTGRGLGGGSRINGLVLEHVTDEYWRALATHHGIATFADVDASAIASHYAGEEAQCLGWLDELLLEIHPSARRARLSTRDGARLSSWDRAGRLPTCDVRLGGTVQELVIHGGRARTVVLVGGQQVRADHVILCAGTVGSAVVARRSEIGGDGVGRQMFDHPSLFIPVTCQSSQACSTFVGALGYTGNVLTMSINPGVNVPGGLLIGLMQPHAVGQVVLEGERVVVDRGMHSDPRDREMMADAVSQLRELTSDERFRHRAQLLDDTLRGDGWLPRIGEGMWHATGTMRMGDADDAVTDCNGLVRGTKNVWCMDAGIFPRVPPVPIQGPTMVAAQVLADRFVSLVTT